MEVKTTWMRRFTEAMTLLCGTEPPADQVQSWFADQDERLQSWAIDNSKLVWAQGIEVIDAASSLADAPEEGAGHGFMDDPALARMGSQLRHMELNRQVIAETRALRRMANRFLGKEVIITGTYRLPGGRNLIGTRQRIARVGICDKNGLIVWLKNYEHNLPALKPRSWRLADADPLAICR